MDTLTDLVILALASWRLAYMLVEEAGPFEVFSRLRYRAGVRSVVTRDNAGQPVGSRTALNTLAEGLTCVWCVSVWAALVLLIPWPPLEWLRLVLAVSGGAIVIHEAIERLRK
jgi:hypothetical protein